MEIIKITREFTIKQKGAEIKLPDPNPVFTPNEVMGFYSSQYPELTTATCQGPNIIKDKQVYTFSTVIGTKG